MESESEELSVDLRIWLPIDSSLPRMSRRSRPGLGLLLAGLRLVFITVDITLVRGEGEETPEYLRSQTPFKFFESAGFGVGLACSRANMAVVNVALVSLEMYDVDELGRREFRNATECNLWLGLMLLMNVNESHHHIFAPSRSKQARISKFGLGGERENWLGCELAISVREF